MAIECKRCGSKLNQVTNSYRKDGTYKGKQITIIRRRRCCRHCGYCWFTNEHFEDLDDWKPIKKKDILKEEESKEPKPKKKANSKDPTNPYLDGD